MKMRIAIVEAGIFGVTAGARAARLHWTEHHADVA